MLMDVMQISSHTILRRTRRLPLAGRALVSLGDAVQPTDVVAEATLPAKTLFLDLARGLGVSTAEVGACLVRAPGDQLKAGDLIAQCPGRLARAVRSPMDARLVDVSRGRAVLATGTETVRVYAGMAGFVEDVIPEYGATLRVEGSLLQGVWGNGRVGLGRLRTGVALEAPLETCQPGDLLALESLEEAEQLRKIRALELGGLIVGSLSLDLIPEACHWDQPVIVLQGFNASHADPLIWDLLNARAGSKASIQALAPNPAEERRPEVIIPYDQGTLEPALGFRAALEPGRQVRILSGAHQGQSGYCIALEKAHTFSNGLKGPAAIVKLNSGVLAPTPQQNLVIVR